MCIYVYITASTPTESGGRRFALTAAFRLQFNGAGCRGDLRVWLGSLRARLIEASRPAGQTFEGGSLRGWNNLHLGMPGLWVHLGDNPEFYDTFTLEKGTYVETNLYDNSHEEQGKGLWRIVSSEARKKEGLWTVAKLLAVSDVHLHWWLVEGPGKEAAREFNLHFCTDVEKDCTKTKRKPSHEFHTDYFRLLDASDLTASKVAWFRQPPAGEDIDLEVTKLTGGTPRGRDRRGVKKGSAPSGHLDWEISDADEIPDLEGLEGEGVNQRLAKLKRQTVGEPEQVKEKDARKRSRSRKKEAQGHLQFRQGQEEGWAHVVWKARLSIAKTWEAPSLS